MNNRTILPTLKINAAACSQVPAKIVRALERCRSTALIMLSTQRSLLLFDGFTRTRNIFFTEKDEMKPILI